MRGEVEFVLKGEGSQDDLVLTQNQGDKFTAKSTARKKKKARLDSGK